MTRARRWIILCGLAVAALGALGISLARRLGVAPPYRVGRRRRTAAIPYAGHATRIEPVADRSPQDQALPKHGPEADTAGRPDHPGRDADTPSRIPARGWWQIGKRVVGQVSEDRVLAEAAGVTFYALLAIFPALAALVSLYGLIADPRTIASNLSVVSGFLPGGGVQLLHDQVQSLTSGPSKGLGLGALVGLLTSIWSANAAMKALFDALNVVYQEKEKRGFVLRTLLTLGFTLGGLVFVILAMTGIVVLPAVLHFIGLDQTTGWLLKLARWPALLVVLSLFLAGVYRYGPSRLKARWRWVSWGGAAATLCWLLVSLAFSYYVENFGNYNKTYGSLGAAIGFMTWIWLSTSVVLVGAELNAEMEHQTARDTTEGPEKPAGQRSARKADQVAAA